MNEKVAEALGYVDEKYISTAARRKKRKKRFLVVVAAILALVLFWNTPAIPLVISAKAVSLAADSRKEERPRSGSDEFWEWYDAQQLREKQVAAAVPLVLDFSDDCSRELLSGAGEENLLWSPINAYIALAMTAELTAGVTQQQVLDVLGAENTEILRTNVSAMWESVYEDDGKEVSVLANSLWLDEQISYYQDVMDTLAYHYYASVYQGDLGSQKTNNAIETWLNNETGGFLKNRTGDVALTENSMLALASTIYFQSQWRDQFSRGMNTTDVFHAPSGDMQVTYMNSEEQKMHYCWGEDYSAVALGLENGSYMWLILPDEDKTVGDVLEDGTYVDMFTSGDGFGYENSKYMKVNLSLPQFDVASGTDLKTALRSMGLTQIFEPLGNDFSPSVDSEIPVYLESINQDTRVAIDEEGVIAASYIELNFGAGAAAPPEEIIDFVLDRPFLFAITTYYGIPLFMGVVNEP